MPKLYRSATDQKIAGICGGLAEVYNVDANLVRLAVVFLGLVTQVVPVVVTYLVAWMLLPEGPSEE
ncbi:MAG: PspC domain-containing protein [Candidatus Marinimicrobia bacterium]|nr:PspC domain-containing protein [Candidatus Neomarinimicrobiota bacterium]